MSTLKTHIILFWQWWFEELHKLIPEKILKIVDKKPELLIYAINAEHIRLNIQGKDNKINSLCSLVNNEENFEEILSVIKKHLNKHSKITFGICVDQSLCLIRNLSYPLSAKPKLPEILNLELEQSTPFKKGDVYVGYKVKPITGERKLDIEHIILKKNIVYKHTNLLNKHNLTLDFIDVWDDQKQALFNCNLLPLKNEKHFFSKYKFSMYFSILCLTFFLANTILANQQHALNGLKQLIINVKKDNQLVVEKKDNILNMKENVQALYNLKRNKPAYILLWKEITQILPNNVWLTDLKIDQDKIQIVGYAHSAASLIEILDNSIYFQNSKIISQIRFDKKTGKEQFSIITELKEKLQISIERKS